MTEINQMLTYGTRDGTGGTFVPSNVPESGKDGTTCGTERVNLPSKLPCVPKFVNMIFTAYLLIMINKGMDFL